MSADDRQHRARFAGRLGRLRVALCAYLPRRYAVPGVADVLVENVKLAIRQRVTPYYTIANVTKMRAGGRSNRNATRYIMRELHACPYLHIAPFRRRGAPGQPHWEIGFRFRVDWAAVDAFDPADHLPADYRAHTCEAWEASRAAYEARQRSAAAMGAGERDARQRAYAAAELAARRRAAQARLAERGHGRGRAEAAQAGKTRDQAIAELRAALELDG